MGFETKQTWNQIRIPIHSSHIVLESFQWKLIVQLLTSISIRVSIKKILRFLAKLKEEVTECGQTIGL